MREIIGEVTLKEKNEIQNLKEHIDGLRELLKSILLDDTELYNKILTEIDITYVQYQKWWRSMALKYEWDLRTGMNYEIEYNTCIIYRT